MAHSGHASFKDYNNSPRWNKVAAILRQSGKFSTERELSEYLGIPPYTNSMMQFKQMDCDNVAPNIQRRLAEAVDLSFEDLYPIEEVTVQELKQMAWVDMQSMEGSTTWERIQWLMAANGFRQHTQIYALLHSSRSDSPPLSMQNWQNKIANDFQSSMLTSNMIRMAALLRCEAEDIWKYNLPATPRAKVKIVAGQFEPIEGKDRWNRFVKAARRKSNFAKEIDLRRFLNVGSTSLWKHYKKTNLSKKLPPRLAIAMSKTVGLKVTDIWKGVEVDLGGEWQTIEGLPMWNRIAALARKAGFTKERQLYRCLLASGKNGATRMNSQVWAYRKEKDFEVGGLGENWTRMAVLLGVSVEELFEGVNK